MKNSHPAFGISFSAYAGAGPNRTTGRNGGRAMWISPMRFQVQKLELRQTEAVCPQCGGRMGLLESQIGPEYFSRLPGAAVKTQAFLICTQCGFQQAKSGISCEHDGEKE